MTAPSDAARALDSLPVPERDRLAPAPAPKTAAVMKAVLTKERFSDRQWIFERKLDGVRCVASRDGEKVRLLSRNDRPLNGRYPEIAEALEREDCRRFVIDGEVVAFEGRQTNFARLAARQQHFVPVFYYVFDLIWLEGYDARGLQLRRRKRLLRASLSFHDRAVHAPSQHRWRGLLPGGVSQALGGPDRQTGRQRLHQLALA